jgi:transposase-like protein
MTIADVSSSREDGQVSSSSGGGPRAGRPKRRAFTAAYKRKIVEEYDRLSSGERGAMLRREGLYHSHIQKWREARDQGALHALPEKPGGRPARGVPEVENERLRKENERLAGELAKTKAALDIMGKARELLEMLSESADSEGKSTE